MILAGLGVFATQGGVITGPLGSPGGAVAAAVAILGGLIAAILPLVKLVTAHREKVSGDERQARTDERQDRSDSIQEWRTIAATYKTERDAAMSRLTVVERQNEQLRDQRTADRMAGLVHSGWDYQMAEAASRAGVTMPPPPPLYAPPVKPPIDG